MSLVLHFTVECFELVEQVLLILGPVYEQVHSGAKKLACGLALVGTSIESRLKSMGRNTW